MCQNAFCSLPSEYMFAVFLQQISESQIHLSLAVLVATSFEIIIILIKQRLHKEATETEKVWKALHI